ncbi:MAG: tocopherol cyclase family protein [Kofleriaceae bacterium]
MTEGAASTEADNLARWDGHRAGFYEVWFITCTDPRTGDGYWIRYVIEAPRPGVDEAHGLLWFARTSATDPTRTFGIHRRIPIASVRTETAPFAVALGAARLGHGHATGALSGDGHAVEWDLRWTPGTRTLHQLPAVMYRRGGLGETTVLSPSVDVAVAGTVTVDGARLELAGAPAGQTHLWGTKHAARWAWAHCNAFDDRPGVAFELLHARLVRRGVALPPLTVAVLRLPDEELALNRFDQALLAGPAELATGRVKFRAGGLTVRLDGELTCRPDDLLRVHYHDPDGDERWNHFTPLGDLRLTVSRRVRGRWKVTDTLTAARRAAFEIAGPTPDPAVTRSHVRVA